MLIANKPLRLVCYNLQESGRSYDVAKVPGAEVLCERMYVHVTLEAQLVHYPRHRELRLEGICKVLVPRVRCLYFLVVVDDLTAVCAGG